MADIPLRLCENMPTVVYAPFYFALSGGYFSRAGLTAELLTSPDPSRTGHMLLEGAADVSWGGPMRVLQHHQADRDPLAHRLELSRCRFMGETPELPLVTFLRLKATLVSGGLLGHDVAYQHVVDVALSQSHPK